jgi:hypothetical protein
MAVEPIGPISNRFADLVSNSVDIDPFAGRFDRERRIGISSGVPTGLGWE